MVKRARNKATERGLFPPHVSFVQCLLTEPLPILSNSVDCVLSNCLVNLLPPSGKNHIFHEIYRVLKPGGRVVLDDVRTFLPFVNSAPQKLQILAKEELPASIRDDMAQYVGCIGGAIPADGYLALLNSAGFKGAHVTAQMKRYSGIRLQKLSLSIAVPTSTSTRLPPEASRHRRPAVDLVLTPKLSSQSLLLQSPTPPPRPSRQRTPAADHDQALIKPP
jgi:SAM-dependent methyltransferase